MAFKVRRKKNINVMRVGIKVGMTVLALYVAGYFLEEIGNVMFGTGSPFYKGLSLIGWTVGTNATCDGNTANCITATNGTGILAIIGIIAVAMLIFEFVDFSY